MSLINIASYFARSAAHFCTYLWKLSSGQTYAIGETRLTRISRLEIKIQCVPVIINQTLTLGSGFDAKYAVKIHISFNLIDL